MSDNPITTTTEAGAAVPIAPEAPTNAGETSNTTQLVTAEKHPDLTPFQSVQQESAGEIVEVTSAGCYVKTAGGTSVLLPYQKGMTDLYTPKVGDFWVVYANGYAFISPRATFLTGHGMDVTPVAAEDDPNAEPNFPHYLRFENGGTDELEAWVKKWVDWRLARPSAVAAKPAA